MSSVLETIIDTTVDYLYTYYYCLVLQTMDELQQQQMPPYRRGVHVNEIRQHFSKYRLGTKIFGELMFIVVSRMARLDAFYCDRHFAQFSRVRLPGYFLFSENIQQKYPGFQLNDTTGLVENLTTPEVNLDTLFALLRSKDLARYEQARSRLFTG